MLSTDFVRNNLDVVKRALANRGTTLSLEQFEELDRARRAAITERDQLKAHCNRLSEEIGALMKAKRKEEAAPKQQEVATAKAQIKDLESVIEKSEGQLSDILLTVPNIPHESVPVGTDETANVEVRRWGTPRQFDFAVKDHVDLGAHLGILDFER